MEGFQDGKHLMSCPGQILLEKRVAFGVAGDYNLGELNDMMFIIQDDQDGDFKNNI